MSCLGRWPLFILVAPVLALLILFSSSTPVLARANDDVHWKCWNSGVSDGTVGVDLDPDYEDQGRDGWGHERAYTVLTDDIRAAAGTDAVRISYGSRGLAGDVSRALTQATASTLQYVPGLGDVVPGSLLGFDDPWESWSHEFSQSFFLTMAEQVDYMFALDIRVGSNDMSGMGKGAGFASSPDFVVAKMNRVFNGPNNPVSADERFSLPWKIDGGTGTDSRNMYLQRKSVAFNNGDSPLVSSFEARWKNPDQPGGGVQEDTGARERDAQAAAADRTAATVNTAVDGHETSLAESEEIVQELDVVTRTRGSGGSQFTVDTTTNSTPITVTVHEQSVEYNDGENHTNDFRETERVSQVCDGSGNCVPSTPIPVRLDETVSENTAIERSHLAEGSYARHEQSDTGHDVLGVDITLDLTNRSDFDSHDSWGPRSRVLSGFSDDPWTMPAFSDGVKPSYLLRTGANSYGVGLNDDPSEHHYGYRQ